MRPFGRLLALAAVTLAGLAVPACQQGTPVAPSGTILRISAFPTRIGKTGSSAITIQALRSNGNPVNPQTEIRLSSTIGQVEDVVYTDNDGIAHGTLQGTGRVGTATISAYSGGVDPVTVDVSVGALATSITLTVDPTSLPQSGGTVDLLALVRDDQGQPLPDAEVNFRTEAGSLDSGGSFLTTDANGQVTDVLHVSAADTASQPDHIITVTAESGGSSGVISDTANITIQSPPIASFTFQINGNVVSFSDTSSGSPTNWHWAFDDGNTSNEQNPVHQYSNTSPGTHYIVVLTVSNAFGSSTASADVNF